LLDYTVSLPLSFPVQIIYRIVSFVSYLMIMGIACTRISCVQKLKKGRQKEC